MAKLSQLVQSKNLDNYVDVGLEKGEIWGYAPAMDLGFAPQIKWQPSEPGRAIVEVWGAGGSGARMCCCGYGLPGNSGAYARKTLCFTPSNYSTSYICGCIGQSCGNASSLCCRGTSSPTCLFYTFDNETTTAVICAQGGKGGWSICEVSNCRIPAGILKNTPCSGGCCTWCGLAFGGDINCPSNISCLWLSTNIVNCPCSYVETIAGPPYQYSTGGACMMVQPGADNVTTMWSGGGPEHSYVIAATSRNPSQGNPWTFCWGAKACGCYETEGCVYYTPPGHGGFPAHPCYNVRDHGGRGGSGAIRIRFVKDS